jgi:hypothetical protein
MPCRSDYPEPSPREIEYKKVSQFLKYVFTEIFSGKFDQFVDADLQKKIRKIRKTNANEVLYGIDKLDAISNLDNTASLCELLRLLPENIIEKLVYDGRNPEARKLADWWDNHQAFDLKREKEEKEIIKQENIRKKALGKLTKKEIEALGLNK